MHPADEYEAFAELHNEQGMPVEDIAARFGVTASVVKQRLKLGAISPTLLSLYREGEINLEQLTAFAITDDHARQEQVWKDLGFHASRRAILRSLTEGQVSIDDRRVSFVGIEAYEAAGGAVIRDLFEEDGAYLADAALLNRLVREKLQRLAEPVLAEGWKWVVVEPEFDYERAAAMTTIDRFPKMLGDEDAAKLAALETQLENLSAEAEQDDATEEAMEQYEVVEAEIAALTEGVYRPEDIARAGAFVALGSNGEARIERGYLRPEDMRRKDRDGDGKADAKATKDNGLSGTLIAELTAHRTAALRNDLAQAPELALIAVTYALAAKTFYRFENLSCLQLTLNHTPLSGVASGIDETFAGQAIAERHQAWQLRLPQAGEALWQFIASCTMDDVLALLAHCASMSLDVVQRPGAHGREGLLAHADTLAAAMPHDMARYWQPTAANYLGRVSKERILDAVREGAGEDAARRIADLKKQAMAQRAEQLLDGKGWLPPALRPADRGDVAAA